MSLSYAEIDLKIDQPAAGKFQVVELRKGAKLDVLFHIITKDAGNYNLTGDTVFMDAEKEDGTGLFGTDESVALVTAAEGRCKWVLTTQLDAIPRDDYIAHLYVMNGATRIEVQEVFILRVLPGTP